MLLDLRIGVLDLVLFIAQHDDHQLERISELKRMFEQSTLQNRER